MKNHLINQAGNSWPTSDTLAGLSNAGNKVTLRCDLIKSKNTQWITIFVQLLLSVIELRKLVNHKKQPAIV